jgi:hypothetical protein
MRTKRLIFISLIFFLAGRKLGDSLLFFCAAHSLVMAICVLICKLEMLSDPKQSPAVASPAKKAP